MGALEKVKQSMSPKEVTIEWDTGEDTIEVPLRFEPMSFGESMLLAKKGDREGEDRFDLQYELLTKMVKEKEDDEWKRISKDDLKDLPQGFVLKITSEVNDYLGISEEMGQTFPERIQNR